jgi:hypothetical protein
MAATMVMPFAAAMVVDMAVVMVNTDMAAAGIGNGLECEKG